MKKIIVTLMLLISSISFSKAVILEKINITNNIRLTILCIDGYKWVMVENSNSFNDPNPEIYQMREQTEFGTKLYVRCK